ncbi:VIT family protein [compost metagenome]
MEIPSQRMDGPEFTVKCFYLKRLIAMNTQNNFWKSRLKEWTVLNMPDRLSEVLFGLIMVLTFTGTISVSTSGKQEVNELMWAALGCNLAWGLVDGIMYIMDTLIGRAHSILQLQKLKKTNSLNASREVIRDNISPLISEIMTNDEIDQLNEKMKQLPEVNIKNSLNLKDFKIAGQIFLLVFLSTLPVALPFLLLQDVALAMRLSNLIALILLFLAGYSLAKYSGLRPWLTAFAYVAIGVFLVVLTIFLGG